MSQEDNGGMATKESNEAQRQVGKENTDDDGSIEDSNRKRKVLKRETL